MSYIHVSMSPIRLLSTKYDDTPQSDVMVTFSRPEVPELTRNKQTMPDGGDLRGLYRIEACSEITGPDGAVTGAARAGAMTVGKDVPLVVTAVLAQPVLESSP